MIDGVGTMGDGICMVGGIRVRSRGGRPSWSVERFWICGTYVDELHIFKYFHTLVLIRGGQALLT